MVAYEQTQRKLVFPDKSIKAFIFGIFEIPLYMCVCVSVCRYTHMNTDPPSRCQRCQKSQGWIYMDCELLSIGAEN